MQKKVSPVLLFFILVSLVVYFARSTFPVTFITGGIEKIFKPLKMIMVGDRVGKDEVVRLKEENVKLLEKFVDLESIKKDNQALRSQFQESPIPTKNLLPAQVIGYVGNFSNPDILVIDKGKNQNVKKGSIVIFGNNLVGVISTVGPEYSSIVLPYNSNFLTLGKTIQGGEGVLRGAGSFIILDKVTIGEKISKGDMVLSYGDINSSGIGIPSDIIVGKITSIEKVETRPFQTAKVESLLDFTKLNLVFVRTTSQ